MGYCSWQGDSGLMAFPPFKPYRTLTIAERKHVKDLARRLHGLSYQPHDDEAVAVCPLHFLRKLYREFATEHRRCVAFKGGHIEKDLLLHLHVSYLDLESIGCPRYDDLRCQETPQETCGWYDNADLHHCAMAEFVTFFEWYKRFVHPPSEKTHTH